LGASTVQSAFSSAASGGMARARPGDVLTQVKISRAFVDGQPCAGLAQESIVDNITLYWLADTGTRRT
jgi:hypothetical protein